MAIDQTINNVFHKNAGNQYKIFYNEEQEADENGELLEPTAADPIAAPTAQAPKDPKAPTAAPPTDPKAPTAADPLTPQDTVAQTTPLQVVAG
jgi:hypothetical protein